MTLPNDVPKDAFIVISNAIFSQLANRKVSNQTDIQTDIQFDIWQGFQGKIETSLIGDVLRQLVKFNILTQLGQWIWIWNAKKYEAAYRKCRQRDDTMRQIKAIEEKIIK
jgi:hypothetical protein